jgi:membrane protein implicated in regulation of membrane protease activity
MSRQLVGVAGILIAVVGIAVDSRMLVWIAIGVLLVAVLWRLVASRRARRNAEMEEDAAGRRPEV